MNVTTTKRIVVGNEELILSPLDSPEELHHGDVVATTVRPDTTRRLRGTTILYVAVIDRYDPDQNGWFGYRKMSVSDYDGKYVTFTTDDYEESFVLTPVVFNLAGLGIHVWRVQRIVRF
jgi:hypothetical protein